MQEKEQISVIIPIYNSSRYLDECLDSVCSQEYPDLEILLIDDGSDDDSLCICMDRAKRDRRCTVFHQENRGLSAARNTGLDLAKGRYIMFLDSDDKMLPGMISQLHELLRKTGAGIAQCGYVEYEEEKNTYNYFIAPRLEAGQYRIYKNEQIFDVLFEFNTISAVQWNKLYKKEVFEQIRFPVGKYHEDEFIIHKELDAAASLVHTSEPLYLYRRHKSGIMGTPTMEKKCHAMEAWYERALFMKERKLIRHVATIQKCMFWLIKTSIREANSCCDASEYLPQMLDLMEKARLLNRDI